MNINSVEISEAISALQTDYARLQAKVNYYEQGGMTPYEMLLGTNSPKHRFTDEGICIRCGEDAEEWDAGCVEERLDQEKERGDRRGSLLDLALNEYYTVGITEELARAIRAELEK